MDQTIIELGHRLCRLEQVVIKLQTIIEKVFSAELTQQAAAENNIDCKDNGSVCTQHPKQPGQLSTTSTGPADCSNEKRKKSNVPVSKTDTHHVVITSNSIQKPWFTDKSDFFTAPEFLERFERYSDIQNTCASDNWMITTVYDCLSGSPKMWYRMSCYKFDSWDRFKALFLQQYWGCRQQREFRKLLHHGQYEDKGKRSKMSSYFARMLTKARYMSLPPSECEVISLLIEHFPTPYREELRHLNKIETLYNFLVEEDLARNINAVLYKTSSETVQQELPIASETNDRSSEGEL